MLVNTFTFTVTPADVPTTFRQAPMPTTRGQKRDADMEAAALKTFFSSPSFAVAGASSNSAKYGHKSKLTTASSATHILSNYFPSIRVVLATLTPSDTTEPAVANC
jgi:hypothetical protein